MGTNVIVSGRFKPHAVRDGNLISGQPVYSGAPAARLMVEALGSLRGIASDHGDQARAGGGTARVHCQLQAATPLHAGLSSTLVGSVSRSGAAEGR